jgi:hypothetical protein
VFCACLRSGGRFYGGLGKTAVKAAYAHGLSLDGERRARMGAQQHERAGAFCFKRAGAWFLPPWRNLKEPLRSFKEEDCFFKERKGGRNQYFKPSLIKFQTKKQLPV